jgi:hypothetical protein
VLLMTLLIVSTPGDSALGEGARAWLAIGLLAILGPVGIVSGIQLLRLRESGRKAALAFVAVLVLFAMAQYRKPPELTGGVVLKLGLMVGSIAILVSERARLICGRSGLGRVEAGQVGSLVGEAQGDGPRE